MRITHIENRFQDCRVFQGRLPRTHGGLQGYRERFLVRARDVFCIRVGGYVRDTLWLGQ